MSRRSENFKRSVQIGLAVLSGGLPLVELACDQAPAIVEPAAGNGIPDLDPTALPQAAPTEARVVPEAPPLAASTAEAQPSPTPRMLDVQSLDDTAPTQSQMELANQTFNFLVENKIVSGDNQYYAYEKNGTIWYEDVDPNNPTLNIGYGRDTQDGPKRADKTIIVAKDKPEDAYVLRVSEINDFREIHDLRRDVAVFNIDEQGRPQGADENGVPTDTRHVFIMNDGTEVARFIPVDAKVNPGVGYEFGENKYSFNSGTGEFTQEPIAPPTPAPEFGMRRQNPDTNQHEYWDGAQWRLPERFEPEPGTFIDVFPTGETVIITPEDEIANALESYIAFSIPGLGAINENTTTQLETENVSVFTHDQGSYTDASIHFKQVFMPMEATRENWILNFDNTFVEIPAIRLKVAYKHTDGRMLNGTLVFSYLVQDGYGNITDNFDNLMRQLSSGPKTFGMFLVTDNVTAMRDQIPQIGQHLSPYKESSVNEVLTAVDVGGFVFGDPLTGNNIAPTRVDLQN
jgi:hypothetical protein